MLVATNRTIRGTGKRRRELGNGIGKQLVYLSSNPKTNAKNKKWKYLGPSGKDSRAALVEVRDAGKPIVVYIHGWGNGNNKIHRRLRCLEDDYGVRTVGFAWPSKGRPPRKQQDKAKRSIEFLSDFLVDLARVGFEKKKVTLLTHSMGNYVMQMLAEHGSEAQKTPLKVFERWVLMAADVSWDHHRQWIAGDFMPTDRWVIHREPDMVLDAAEGLDNHIDDARRLGRGGSTAAGGQAETNYLDCTSIRAANGITTSHSYFLGKQLDKNDVMRGAFEQMLQCKKVKVDKLKTVNRPSTSKASFLFAATERSK